MQISINMRFLVKFRQTFDLNRNFDDRGRSHTLKISTPVNLQNYQNLEFKFFENFNNSPPVKLIKIYYFNFYENFNDHRPVKLINI